MKKLKVIGIGSRIMGDDGIGVYVVEELINQKFMPNSKFLIGETDAENVNGETGIEFVLGETDIDYCLDHIDNNSTVIIIDAASSGKTPGTVTEFTPTDKVLFTSTLLSAHNQSIIEVAKTRISSNNIIIIGIEPMTIDYQLELSDTLSKAFEQIMEDVKTCLTKAASN